MWSLETRTNGVATRHPGNDEPQDAVPGGQPSTTVTGKLLPQAAEHDVARPQKQQTEGNT